VDEPLTLAEIQSRYASEWVLLGEPQTDETLEVQSRRVLHHRKDRDEVYRKAIALLPRRFALLYTGTLADDAAFAV